MTYNGLLGIGLLGTLTGTMDVYDTTQVGGYYTEVADGNVITDINTSGGNGRCNRYDCSYSSKWSACYSARYCDQRLYGTLVIDPDGTYTYTLLQVQV